MTGDAISAPAPEAGPTLWGYTLSDLQDMLWKSLGMQVVWPGRTREIDFGSELFLLMATPGLLRLDLQPVLDRLYWTPQDVIILGLNNNSSNGSTSAWLPPVRFALTAKASVADYWKNRAAVRGGQPTAFLWRALRNHWPAHIGMRLRGRAYPPCGEGWRDFAAGLVSDFSDPDTIIPGLQRLGHGVWGPHGSAHMKGRPSCQPLWIGHGWDLDRLVPPPNQHVLFDVPPNAAPAVAHPGVRL